MLEVILTSKIKQPRALDLYAKVKGPFIFMKKAVEKMSKIEIGNPQEAEKLKENKLSCAKLNSSWLQSYTASD